MGCLTLNGTPISYPSPNSRLRNHHGLGSRKIIRVRGNNWLQGNPVFQKQHGSYINELTLVVTIWPVQLQVKPNLSMERDDKGTKSHPYMRSSWQLITTIRWKSQFFLKGITPGRLMKIQLKAINPGIWMSSTNWTWWIWVYKKRGYRVGQIEKGGRSGRSWGRRSDYGQNSMPFSKH